MPLTPTKGTTTSIHWTQPRRWCYDWNLGSCLGFIPAINHGSLIFGFHTL